MESNNSIAIPSAISCAVVLAYSLSTMAQQEYPAVKWSGQVKDVVLEKAKPTKEIIDSQEEFAKLWKAWMLAGDAPRVSFEQYCVVVLTSKNRILSMHGYYRRENEVKGIVGFKEGKLKGFSYLIGVFPRELVEAAQKKSPQDKDK